jgi:RNA polymerase sigma factor (TIGR02999 family)
MQDVSQLLHRWTGGDESALAELIPVVYAELRRLGRRSLKNQRDQLMLQPTALVHEAWLRLAGKTSVSLVNRAQFYALAGKIMRDILVDHVRRERASKRGGSRVGIALDDAAATAAKPPRHVDFLILDESLTRLGDIKPRYTQIAEMRYLAGLTIEETAAALHVSHATIEREWRIAQAWLRRELKAEPPATGKER